MPPSLHAFTCELEKTASPLIKNIAKSSLMGMAFEAMLNRDATPLSVIREGVGYGVGDELASHVAGGMGVGRLGRFAAGMAGGHALSAALRRRFKEQPVQHAVDKLPDTEEFKAVKQAAVTRSVLTPQSSNVAGYSYDPATESLNVTFKGGGTYAYKGVPKRAVRNLARSKSVGKAVNRIKATSEYEKVGAPLTHAQIGQRMSQRNLQLIRNADAAPVDASDVDMSLPYTKLRASMQHLASFVDELTLRKTAKQTAFGEDHYDEADDAGWKDKLPGGPADDKFPSDFDFDALDAGMKHELKHTKDRNLAMEIAMDRLTEDPAHYAKQKQLDKQAGVIGDKAKALAALVKRNPGKVLAGGTAAAAAHGAATAKPGERLEGAAKVLPTAATAAAGFGAYKFLRTPTFSSNPALRKIQERASKKGFHRIVDVTHDPDAHWFTPNATPDGKLTLANRLKLLAHEGTTEAIPIVEGKATKILGHDGPKKFDGVIYGRPDIKSRAKTIRGGVDIEGSKRTQRTQHDLAMSGKRGEAELLNTHARDSIPETHSDISRLFKKLPADRTLAIRELKARAIKDLGDDVILKPTQGLSSAGSFPPTNENWERYITRFDKHMADPKKAKAFGKAKASGVSDFTEYLHDHNLYEGHVLDGALGNPRSVIAQRLVDKPLAEWRVHAIAGTAPQEMMSQRHGGKATTAIKAHLNRGDVKAGELKSFVEKTIKKLPPKYRKGNYAFDVLPYVDDTGKTKFKIIEMNPTELPTKHQSGGGSGFLDSSLVNFPGHGHYRAVTGRHAPVIAGAGAALASGATAATIAGGKAVYNAASDDKKKPGQDKTAGVAKRQTRFDGLPIKIEQDPGDVRSGTSKDGKSWSRPMHAGYGYVPGTKGLAADGDAVDVYLAKDPVPGAQVYEVSQNKKGGGFDEHKYMVGYETAAAAKASYLRHMPSWAFASMTSLSMDELKRQYKLDDRIEKTADIAKIIRLLKTPIKGTPRLVMKVRSKAVLDAEEHALRETLRDKINGNIYKGLKKLKVDKVYQRFEPIIGSKTSPKALRDTYGERQIHEMAHRPFHYLLGKVPMPGLSAAHNLLAEGQQRLLKAPPPRAYQMPGAAAAAAAEAAAPTAAAVKKMTTKEKAILAAKFTGAAGVGAAGATAIMSRVDRS